MRDGNGSPPGPSVDRGGIFNPLLDFYRAAGITPPEFVEVPGEKMPEPYRSLLVHSGDMTPALEAFHKRKIYLQVIESQRDPIYRRQVVLHLDGTAQAVEFGAIVIHLENFTAPPRAEILQGKHPLGSILHDHSVLHLSQPRSFFSVKSDASIEAALGMKRSAVLYGRGNRLVAPNGDPLAEIIEILPE